MSGFWKMNWNKNKDNKNTSNEEIKISLSSEIFDTKKSINKNETTEESNQIFDDFKKNRINMIETEEVSDKNNDIVMPTNEEWEKLELKILNSYRELNSKKDNNLFTFFYKPISLFNIFSYSARGLVILIILLFCIFFSSHLLNSINSSINYFSKYQQSKDAMVSLIPPNNSIYIYPERTSLNAIQSKRT